MGNTERMLEKLVNRIDSLESLVTSMGKILGSVEPNKILAVEGGDRDQVEDTDSEVEDNPNPWKRQTRSRAKPSPLGQIMRDALAEQKKEEDQQEKRDHNIIIFRAAESIEAESKKRMEFDREFFQELCTDVLDVGPINIEEVTRLGKPNQERARPLRIKLKDKLDKLRISAKLKNLKNAEDKFAGISVADDLSQRDRDEIRLLSQEAKNWMENNEAESWKYRVKGTTGTRWVHWIRTKPVT